MRFALGGVSAELAGSGTREIERDYVGVILNSLEDGFAAVG
jgi:hypothetical protein